MSKSNQFQVNEFLLTIFDSAYLVEVRPAHGLPRVSSKQRSMPDWVFHSAHAIWLTEEDAPLSARAIHGERIRKQLRNAFGHRLRIVSRKRIA